MPLFPENEKENNAILIVLQKKAKHVKSYVSLIKSKICKALNNNGPSGDRVTIEGNSERFHTIHKAGKLEAGEGDTATQMSASAWRRKKIVSHNIKEKTSN